MIVILFLGVVHLQSIGFGKNSEEGFRFRHGPMVKHSVPITNIQQVNAPVDYEIGVDLKEEPAGPDSLAYDDCPPLLVSNLPRGQIKTDYTWNMEQTFSF